MFEGEFTKITNSLAPELAKTFVVLWDIGSLKPAPPAKPALPKGKEGDAEYDVAMVEFREALDEYQIAYKAFTSVNNPHDKTEVAAALHNVVIPDAVAGPMDFTSSKNPAPGVVITPPVGIQWQKVKGSKYPLEAVVVDNTLNPQAKITGDLLPTFK